MQTKTPEIGRKNFPKQKLVFWLLLLGVLIFSSQFVYSAPQQVGQFCGYIRGTDGDVSNSNTYARLINILSNGDILMFLTATYGATSQSIYSPYRISTDRGVSWGAAVDPGIRSGVTAPSIWVDTNNDIHIACSHNTGVWNISSRKLAYTGSNTWSNGGPVSTSMESVSYPSIPVIVRESHAYSPSIIPRLWITYFVRTQNSVSEYRHFSYYSDDDGVTWTFCEKIDDGEASRNYSYSAFGLYEGYPIWIYSWYNALHSRLWDGVSSWGAIGAFSHISDIGDLNAFASTVTSSNGTLHFAIAKAGQIKYAKRPSGGSWDASSTTIDAAATNDTPVLSSDGVNIWVTYLKYNSAIIDNEIYTKRWTSINNAWDASPALVYSPAAPTLFDKVFLYGSTAGTTVDKTTEACNDTGTTDVSHTASGGILKDVGDKVYFGKSTQFNTLMISVTNGLAGSCVWEYYSTTGWKAFDFAYKDADSAANYQFKGSYVENNSSPAYFWKDMSSVPGDWITTTQTEEGTSLGGSSYYLVRARATVAYTTAPRARYIISYRKRLKNIQVSKDVKNILPITWEECSSTSYSAGSYSYPVYNIMADKIDVAPAVTAVTPSTSANSDAITLTVTGSGFYSGISSIRLDDSYNTPLNLTNLSILSDSSFSGAVIPSATVPAGTYNVLVTTNSGWNLSSSKITVICSAPTVSTILPNIASSTGNTSLTVAGTNFFGGTATSDIKSIVLKDAGGSTVTNVSYSAPLVSDLTISNAVVPPGLGNGTYYMVVTTGGGSSTTSEQTKVIVGDGPIVSTVLPLTGVNTTLVTLTITGLHFTGIVSVGLDDPDNTLFNTGSAVMDDVSITGAVIPVNSAKTGTYNVRVTNAIGSNATSAQKYVVTTGVAPSITGVNPAAALNNSLSTVTVEGSGFYAGSKSSDIRSMCMNKINTSGVALTVSSITAASGLLYTSSNLQVGNYYYIDSTCTLTGIPQQYSGLKWVMTAYADKNIAANPGFLTFTVSKDVTVYVGIDKDIVTPMSWLSTWTYVEAAISAYDTSYDGASPYKIYSKNFNAGTVTLGANEGNNDRSMYLVLVKEQVPYSPTVNISVYSCSADTLMQAAIPSTLDVGTYDVKFTTGGGTNSTSSAARLIIDASSPVVSEVSPSTGTNATDVSGVTIKGQYFFAGGTSTKVNYIALKQGASVFTSSVFNVVNDTLIVSAAFPLHNESIPPGVYEVIVNTVKGSNSTSTQKFTVSGPVPEVGNVTPSASSNLAPVTLNITGTYFFGGSLSNAVTAVKLDTFPLETSLNIAGAVFTDTTINGAVVPQGVKTGTYNVKVTTPAGTNSTSVIKLLVTTSSPQVGSVSPNTGINNSTTGISTQITVYGSGFLGGTAALSDVTSVQLLGNSAINIESSDYAVVSDTSLNIMVVKTGLMSGKYKVNITNSSGANTGSVDFYLLIDKNDPNQQLISDDLVSVALPPAVLSSDAAVVIEKNVTGGGVTSANGIRYSDINLTPHLGKQAWDISGTLREISIFPSGTTLAGNIPVTISYRNAGINDPVLEKKFRIVTLNANNKWELVAGEQVTDTVNKRVTVSVNHFSIFRIAEKVQAANDLSNVIIFPNPVDFSGAVRNSIKFTNLTADPAISIYTLSGELVKTLEPGTIYNDGISGQAEWDGLNDQNTLVARGLYLYLIKDAAGNRKTGKFAVR